jgi:hypothetical protein
LTAAEAQSHIKKIVKEGLKIKDAGQSSKKKGEKKERRRRQHPSTTVKPQG